jgi:hypothetical protein
MKVTINVECPPEEARAFFGLPDVKPLQEAMMAEMQKRMEAGMSSMDMESLMKTWLPNAMTGSVPGAMAGAMPNAMPGLEQFQKMFWDSMAAASDNMTAATNMATGQKSKSKKTKD